MGTIYGYIRVSHARQAESGLGLSAQQRLMREKMKDRAKRRGLKEGKICRDAAVSASKMQLRRRPAGGKLIQAAQAGDHVVIAKLDRAFRSLRDCTNTLSAWAKEGVAVHILDIGVDTDTPTGRLMIGIMATLAQWESERIGERIRDAKRAQRSSGGWPTYVAPLGYSVRRRKLVADKRERQIGRRAVRMRDRGMTYQEIADRFNTERVRRSSRHAPKQSRKWTPQSISRLIAACRAGWPAGHQD